MIYWQRCQSEIAKALGMQISDINNEKLYIAACNGDWNAYQGHLNSIMILLIPVPKSSPYLSQKTSLFCRPLQNSTFLSCP